MVGRVTTSERVIALAFIVARGLDTTPINGQLAGLTAE
jgi:hypothetical protein